MGKLFMILPLVCLLCITLSCQQGEEVAEVETVGIEVDVEADVTAIKGLLDEYDALLNAGEPEKLVSLYYAEDAVRMPTDAPLVKGKSAVLEWFKKWDEVLTHQLDNVPEDIQVDGDLAFMRGTYSGSITPKAGGEPIPVIGKWMAVYKRQADGSWKVIADIFNRDNPLPAEEE